MTREEPAEQAPPPPGAVPPDEAKAPTVYSIEVRPLIGALERLDLRGVIDATTDPWFNQTLCEVDGTAVRLGVLQGEFHWHRHEREDEFFLVLQGGMRIELEGREAVALGPLQAFIVPKGMLHRPVVPERTVVLMLERAGVLATGD
jgi:mannose-6-phosphate isomerase-like protein (cupin superfamily)